MVRSLILCHIPQPPFPRYCHQEQKSKRPKKPTNRCSHHYFSPRYLGYWQNCSQYCHQPAQVQRVPNCVLQCRCVSHNLHFSPADLAGHVPCMPLQGCSTSILSSIQMFRIPSSETPHPSISLNRRRSRWGCATNGRALRQDCGQ